MKRKGASASARLPKATKRSLSCEARAQVKIHDNFSGFTPEETDVIRDQITGMTLRQRILADIGRHDKGEKVFGKAYNEQMRNIYKSTENSLMAQLQVLDDKEEVPAQLLQAPCECHHKGHHARQGEQQWFKRWVRDQGTCSVVLVFFALLSPQLLLSCDALSCSSVLCSV